MNLASDALLNGESRRGVGETIGMRHRPAIMAPPVIGAGGGGVAAFGASARGGEIALLFALAPAGLLLAGGGLAATAVIAHWLFWAGAALLSRSPDFLWRDLWPRDGLSEWRLIMLLPSAVVAAAALAGHTVGPAGDWRLAAPLALLAVAIELVHRVLPRRRYPLAPRWSSVNDACATALLYFAATGGGWRAAAFGAGVGWLCGRLLDRAGNFPLIALTHAAAVAAMATVGPGLR